MSNKPKWDYQYDWLALKRDPPILCIPKSMVKLSVDVINRDAGNPESMVFVEQDDKIVFLCGTPKQAKAVIRYLKKWLEWTEPNA